MVEEGEAYIDRKIEELINAHGVEATRRGAVRAALKDSINILAEVLEQGDPSGAITEIEAKYLSPNPQSPQR